MVIGERKRGQLQRATVGSERTRSKRNGSRRAKEPKVPGEQMDSEMGCPGLMWVSYHEEGDHKMRNSSHGTAG